MTRSRYWYDRATRELVDYADRLPPHAGGERSTIVVKDIDPYRSMRTGEMIGGRRQHRDHLRAHGCIEIGNEMPKIERHEFSQADRIADIKRAMGE